MRTAKPITQIRFQTFLTAFVLSILSACGSFQVQIENDVAGADIPAAQVAPVEVLVARDTALFYLREIYGESIPPGDTVWTLTQMPSDGLVGASTFRFESLGWTVVITFPIVLPEETIYALELFNSTSGFHWQGQVDAQGNVSDLIEPVEDIRVTAWAGRFETLVEGAGPDDYFIMIPEGTGAVGLEAADEELESMIALLAASDADYVHVWGTLSCGVEDFNNCRLVVERLRQGTEITEPQAIAGWEGVIYKSPPDLAREGMTILRW